MEDILKIVKDLQGASRCYDIGALELNVADAEKGRLDTKSVINLHIEAQTYMLAEILQEMRRMNAPIPTLHFDLGKRDHVAR